MNVVRGYYLPGLPHILLAPERNDGWQKIRQAFDRVRDQVSSSGADVIIYYSTYWPSVIGHQIQADPEPEWVHVDDQFHDLGSIHYKFKVDADLAKALRESCEERGLHARTVAYHGFPIDTGTVVVNKLINPDNKIPFTTLSSNIYSDRKETIVYGKATRDAVEAQGKKAIMVAISSLSNRLFTEEIDPKEDHIHSRKDQEWNEKFIELVKEGRLEDCSQLSRQFHREARVQKVVNYKPFWWLAAAMGQSNNYEGEVFEYQPILGTGAAVMGLTPSQQKSSNLEYDEDDVDFYAGNRNVLDNNEDFSTTVVENWDDEDKSEIRGPL